MRYGIALSLAKTPLTITLIQSPFQRVSVLLTCVAERLFSAVGAAKRTAVPMTAVARSADEKKQFAAQTLPRSERLEDGVQSVLRALELLTPTAVRETTGLSASKST